MMDDRAARIAQLEAENAALRAELQRSNAERDEALEQRTLALVAARDADELAAQQAIAATHVLDAKAAELKEALAGVAATTAAVEARHVDIVAATERFVEAAAASGAFAATNRAVEAQVRAKHVSEAAAECAAKTAAAIQELRAQAMAAQR